MLKLKSIGAWLLLGVCFVVCAPAASAQTELFDGRPEFKEGHDMGYFVWREGDTWKLRWTTTGAMRRFTGHVTAEDGALKSLKRIDLETERRVLRPGRPPRLTIGPRGRIYERSGRPTVVTQRAQDKIEKEGNHRINFTTRTDDDIDGFDFKVDDKVTVLRFMLEINGKALPRTVETGKNNQHPPNVPFEVKLR
ncbi:MAG: hypothetical protein HY011_21335 [Acidobacteria bacterium]|nr:hypothetical protein [Acidobacteriota bacterium]